MIKNAEYTGGSTMDKTLRDEIAIEAMKVLMVMPIQELIDMYGHRSVSKAAYEQADALLLARSKKDN